MKRIKVLFFFISVLLGAGCAKHYDYVTKLSKDIHIYSRSQVSLLNSAMNYREALSKEDLKTAYNYELPYQKYLLPFNEYRQRHSHDKKHYHVKILTVKIDNKDPEKGYVRFIPLFDGNRRTFTAIWFKIDGKWFHKMELSLLPTPQH